MRNVFSRRLLCCTEVRSPKAVLLLWLAERLAKAMDSIRYDIDLMLKRSMVSVLLFASGNDGTLRGAPVADGVVISPS